jgi:hypothetical protein
VCTTRIRNRCQTRHLPYLVTYLLANLFADLLWSRSGSIRIYVHLELELPRWALRKAQPLSESNPVEPRRQTGPTVCGDLSRTRVERWKVNHCARGTAWRASCGSMCGRVCVQALGVARRIVSCRVELELAQRRDVWRCIWPIGRVRCRLRNGATGRHGDGEVKVLL